MPNQNESKNSYSLMADRMGSLANKYGGTLPMNDIYSAFINAGGYDLLMPQAQNRRVRTINTRPVDLGKDEIANMVSNPEGNEEALRAVSASLAYSTKTYDLILQTYQDVLTYNWYIYPTWTPDKVDKKQMMRDYALAYKVANAMDIKAKAHEIMGQCVEYGKVFYTPRVSVDKAHNAVQYAFLQQLPTDWCKIVGFNNGAGKYTVAFNLMYFCQAGTDYRQFGNLFTPYLAAFEEVLDKRNAKKPRIDIDKFKELQVGNSIGSPQWLAVGNVWYYWVTLPAEEVITFEINDRSPLVIPPTTGLMVSMTQIPNYEAAQMEVILNPLTSVLTGSLETYDPKGSKNEDPIRVSNGVREMFETLWYQMLNKNNTAGIGVYLAPASDLKLQTLSDTVSNTDITSTAISDQVLKSGLSGLIPTNDPKVGVAQVSAAIVANYGMIVYNRINACMDFIFEKLKLKTPLKFKMFGDIFSKKDELDSARQAATLGLLPEALRYDALIGHSLLDDLAMSDFVKDCGILEKRIPLSSTYTGGLNNPVGRPTEEGSENSEKTEPILQEGE